MTTQGTVLSTQLRLYLRGTRGQKPKLFRVGLSRALNFAPATALERMLGPFDVIANGGSFRNVASLLHEPRAMMMTHR